MLDGHRRARCVGTFCSLTLYVQKDSPGKDREANWLPAPDGPFYCIMRIYIPKPRKRRTQLLTMRL
jgi:hypothetical protein